MVYIFEILPLQNEEKTLCYHGQGKKKFLWNDFFLTKVARINPKKNANLGVFCLLILLI
jgi:hypothetical protein